MINRQKKESKLPVQNKAANISLIVFSSYLPAEVSFLFLQYNPLKVWLYRGGFARFSNSRFSLDSIEDTCILSLTNL